MKIFLTVDFYLVLASMSTWGDWGRRGFFLLQISSASQLYQKSKPDVYLHHDWMWFNQCLPCTRICPSVLSSLIWPSNSTNWYFYHFKDPEYRSHWENMFFPFEFLTQIYWQRKLKLMSLHLWRCPLICELCGKEGSRSSNPTPAVLWGGGGTAIYP